MDFIFWVLGTFSMIGFAAMFTCAYFQYQLRKLCLSFKKNGFFSPNRKILYSDIIAEGFITIDFQHKDFPHSNEKEIKTKYQIVNISLLLGIGMFFCIILSIFIYAVF